MIRWLVAIPLLALAGCAAAPPVERQRTSCSLDVERLLAQELARRPDATPEQLYTLVREAAIGGRPVSETELQAELLRAGLASPQEPIVEDLDEDAVRLNLRKWRFVGGSARELAAVVACSAPPPDGARLAACMDEAAARGGPGLARLVEELRGEGLPEAPNSANYVETNRPAWRVVLRRCLPPWVTAPPPGTG